MKQCSKCGIEKQIESFGKHCWHKDGHRSICKECESKIRKMKDRKCNIENRRDWENKQRESLSDWWIKKCILIASKKKIKTNQITSEMIKEKRKSILELRFKRENHLLKKDRIKDKKRICAICGKTFNFSRNTRRCCSDKCSYEYALNQQKVKYKNEWKPAKPFQCEECGELHQPEFGDTATIFCSDTCRKRNQRRNKSKGAWAYRRYKNVKNGERFQVKEIYDRDGWICGICHKPVNSRLRFPHPKSPSLDHIIPIAIGGSHIKKNVQLAHLSCNVSIGIGGIKQLRLIG